MRRWSKREERGAIAVLVSLVLVGAALPLAGLGYSAYLRGATNAELQRSADAGALAGAAAIPLGDLTFVTNYVNNVSGLPIPLPPGAADPLAIACNVARRSALEDDGFTRNYASPVPDGTANPVCAARYLPDSGIVGALVSCLGQLRAAPLLNVLGIDLFSNVRATLRRTLPAVMTPAIRVTLTTNVRGPMDGLNPADNGLAKTQTVTAEARRRFKNLVVIPTVPLPGPGGTLDLNPFLGETSAQLMGVLNSLTSAVLTPMLSAAGLGSCAGIAPSLSSDLSDLINPPDAGAPAIGDVLAAAAADAAPVFALRIPASPLSGVLAALNIPFLDFVPVCVSGLTATVQSLTSTAGCMVNAPGVFRATLVK